MVQFKHMLDLGNINGREFDPWFDQCTWDTEKTRSNKK